MTIHSERRPDLDWLRVLGVLLLIPFHAALIFAVDPDVIMYIKDAEASRVLDAAAGFIHMWHMPMLFILSGQATYFALGFRSPRDYIRERFLRLFVPLLFGILTFVPFTIHIQHSDVQSLREGYLGFFRLDVDHLDGMTGTFTPAHLWFILYLFVYSLAGLPLFLALRSESRRRWIESWWAGRPGVLSLVLMGIPLTLAAATNILGAMNPLYYFLMFLFGYLLAENPRAQQAIHKWTWVCLAFGMSAAALNVLLPVGRYPDWSWQWMALGLVYQMGRWSLTLSVLGLGHRFLNRSTRMLRYARQAAMPFYLLHMTFSVAAGYFVIQLDEPVAVKYPLIVLAATGLTLLAYEGVRRWQVTRWLFGMKSARQAEPSLPASVSS